jgi:hypothetical protein
MMGNGFVDLASEEEVEDDDEDDDPRQHSNFRTTEF